MSIDPELWIQLAGKEEASTITQEEIEGWTQWIDVVRRIGYSNNLLEKRGLDALAILNGYDEWTVPYYQTVTQYSINLSEANELVKRANHLKLDPLTWVEMCRRMDLNPVLAAWNDQVQRAVSYVTMRRDMGLDPLATPEWYEHQEGLRRANALGLEANVWNDLAFKLHINPVNATDGDMKVAFDWLKRVKAVGLDPLAAELEVQRRERRQQAGEAHAREVGLEPKDWNDLAIKLNIDPVDASVDDIKRAITHKKNAEMLELDPLVASAEDVESDIQRADEIAKKLEIYLEDWVVLARKHQINPVTATDIEVGEARRWLRTTKSFSVDPHGEPGEVLEDVVAARQGILNRQQRRSGDDQVRRVKTVTCGDNIGQCRDDEICINNVCEKHFFHDQKIVTQHDPHKVAVSSILKKRPTDYRTNNEVQLPKVKEYNNIHPRSPPPDEYTQDVKRVRNI